MSKIKLILGTANFNPKGYGNLSSPLSLVEIRFILEYAKKHGISILEGSDAYNCDEVLTDLSFDLIYKVTNPYSLHRVLDRTRRFKLLGLLYHHGLDTKAQTIKHVPPGTYSGSSIYTRSQLIGTEEMVEVPLNIENREFEKFEAPCKIVRSVFGRGDLLKTHTVKECLEYIKSNPTIHGLIISVDNVKQLEEILEVWKQPL